MQIRGSDDFLKGRNTSTGTGDTLLISGTSGKKTHVTSIIISNSSATNTEVDIKDGSTTIATFPAPTVGGAIHAFQTPLVLSAGADLNFASVAGVTTMKVTAVGYKGE